MSTFAATSTLSTKADISSPLKVSDGTLEALKWLALVLMTLDHINKYLFNEKLPHVFELGRVAMPLFACVLAYNLARPDALSSGVLNRITTRLTLWAAVASVPFIALGSLSWGWWPLNILATLALASCIVWLTELGGTTRMVLATALFALGGLIVEFWWPGVATVLLARNYVQKPTTARLIAFVLALASLWFINQTGWALAALPILYFATRVNVRVPRVKHLFYAYYPAHLAVLYVIKSAMA